jgi:hypothetical protein
MEPGRGISMGKLAAKVAVVTGGRTAIGLLSPMYAGGNDAAR